MREQANRSPRGAYLASLRHLLVLEENGSAALQDLRDRLLLGDGGTALDRKKLQL